jgi:nucleotide-binding universal stress UspA family protein
MNDVRSGPFRHLLVATDISTSASAALDWAIDIACQHQARMTLVHSIEQPPDRSIELTLQSRVTHALAGLERRVRQAGIEVESRCRTGRAWEAIIATEVDVEPDLILIGARGHTPYSRLLLGSTADRVVRAAGAPVLVVHPRRDESAPRVRTVLAATDFSEEAAIAVHEAVRLVRHSSSQPRVVLLHASHTPLEYEAASVAAILSRHLADGTSAARRRLETMAAPIRDEGIEVQIVVREGYPASAIEEEAQAWAADLVAVGTHGRGGFRHMLIGSVAERVLHHLACPVLTVRHAACDDRALAKQTSAAHVADANGQEN